MVQFILFRAVGTSLDEWMDGWMDGMLLGDFASLDLPFRLYTFFTLDVCKC